MRIKLFHFSVLPLAVAAVYACGHDTPTTIEPASGTLQLVLVDPSVSRLGLRPGESTSIAVRVVDENEVAVPAVTVLFGASGEPKGSTFSTDRALTNNDGIAAIKLHAGSSETSFVITIDASTAIQRTISVDVSSVGFGAIVVSTAYSGTLKQQDLTAVTLVLHDQRSCAELPVVTDVQPFWRVDGQQLEQSFTFSAIRLDKTLALLAIGQDAYGRSRAASCVDIPAGLLRGSKPVSVTVELHDPTFQIEGTYAVVSKLGLPTKTAAILETIEPWSDLHDCTNGPAQLIINCVLDALDSADDIDCVLDEPTSEVAIELTNQRGTLDGRCHGDNTVDEKTSLDALLRQAMDSDDENQQIALLAAVAPLLVEKLETISVSSTLKISEATTPTSNQLSYTYAEHALKQIKFGTDDASAVYDLSGFVLPRRRATAVLATIDSGWLTLEQHTLSLRLDLLLPQVLNNAILDNAELPTAPTDIVQLLANLVTSEGLSGCDAIRSVLCSALERDDTCLADACETGLSALATRFGSVLRISPADADLSWSGTSPFIDTNADLVPESLGDSVDPYFTGSWTAVLQLGDTPVTIDDATFTAEREL